MARDGGAWPIRDFLGAFAVLVGAGLAILGVARALDQQDEPADPGLVEAPLRTVAQQVTARATDTQGSGADHVVRTSKGKLLVLFVQDGALFVSADEANRGLSWRSPIRVEGISVQAFSAAIDERDRVHLAYHDGSVTRWALLTQDRDGWRVASVADLDAAPGGEIVDVEVDPATSTADVVWSASTTQGSAPAWARILVAEDAPPVVSQRRRLSRGGPDSVLVNIARDPEGELMIVYSGGDQPRGLAARRAVPGEDDVVAWEPVELLPTEAEVGALDLGFSHDGVAHVVARDDDAFRILHLRRRPRAGWSSPLAAISGDSITEIDRPTLSIDAVSRLVYLFFQTDRFDGAAQVRMAVFDPAKGWGGPYALSAREGTGVSSTHPLAIDVDAGQPVVFWTASDGDSEIQAARVSAP